MAVFVSDEFDSSLSPEVASSVTRNLLNPNLLKNELLLCGIDTLDLGLYVKFDDWDRIKTYLEEKKTAAQSKTCNLDQAGERQFLHQPTGKPPSYRYQLLFPEYRIYLSQSGKLHNTPNAYVSILAASLWHEDLDTITALIELDLTHFGGTVERIKPSRLDLCADFKLSSPLTVSFIEQLQVSRSRKRKQFLNGDELESYYCGCGDSEVQIRIYDKSKEIRKSGKDWFLNLWQVDLSSSVWRVEFQLRRQFLKQMNINSMEELQENLAAIWSYLTQEWYSLRLPDNDKAERRTVHPFWKSVQNACQLMGEDNGTKRSFTADEMLPVKKILPHIIGRMISIAALKKLDNRSEALIHLFDLVSQYCPTETFNQRYREKLIKLGYRGELMGGSDDSDDPHDLRTVTGKAQNLEFGGDE